MQSAPAIGAQSRLYCGVSLHQKMPTPPRIAASLQSGALREKAATPGTNPAASAKHGSLPSRTFPAPSQKAQAIAPLFPAGRTRSPRSQAFSPLRSASPALQSAKTLHEQSSAPLRSDSTPDTRRTNRGDTAQSDTRRQLPRTPAAPHTASQLHFRIRRVGNRGTPRCSLLVRPATASPPSRKLFALAGKTTALAGNRSS